MASDPASRPTSPADHDDAFPNPQRGRSEMAGPPSIISSRMTDIASDDGNDNDPTVPPASAAGASSNRRSLMASEAPSRPGTARTGVSSTRGGPAWSQSQQLRKNHLSGLATKRGSNAGSVAGSVSSAAARPASSASRSHVPSLTSHAFFRPMSSQKLQAQRGNTARPLVPLPQVEVDQGDGASITTTALGAAAVAAAGAESTTAASNPTARYSATSSNPVARTREDGRLPSRGSEMTEQGTMDRITANTSPTQGHHPTGSLSESMRPLQRRPAAEGGADGSGGARPGGGGGLGGLDGSRQLRVDVDKGYPTGSGGNAPAKSPRSFRSSFLLPGMGGGNSGGGNGDDGSQAAANRNMQGAEKLSSTASSPRLHPADIKPSRLQGGGRSGAKGAKTNLGRVYEYFDGNMVFCFGGRWSNAKQRPVSVATFLFVIVPCTLFFVFSAPWLWRNISPAIPITFAYVFFIALSSLIHGSVSDPGILPRNLHRFPAADDNDDPLRLGPPLNDWVLVKSADSATAAMEVPVKYCRTCNIWRPPRAHHCRLCDNCVDTHDHHCVWFNNCVGRRNYRYFFSFVASASLLSLYLIGASLTQILVHASRSGISVGDAIDELRVPFANIVLGFLGFLYPAALTAYHVWLMARGEMTRELMNSHKFVKKERYRAFTQGGVLRNWAAVLCRPRPPTYYRFKRPYVAGDQRLGEVRRRNRRRGPGGDGGAAGLEMHDVKPSSGFEGPVGLRRQSPVARDA